ALESNDNCAAYHALTSMATETCILHQIDKVLRANDPDRAGVYLAYSEVVKAAKVGVAGNSCKGRAGQQQGLQFACIWRAPESLTGSHGSEGTKAKAMVCEMVEAALTFCNCGLGVLDGMYGSPSTLGSGGRRGGRRASEPKLRRQQEMELTDTAEFGEGEEKEEAVREKAALGAKQVATLAASTAKKRGARLEKLETVLAPMEQGEAKEDVREDIKWEKYLIANAATYDSLGNADKKRLMNLNCPRRRAVESQRQRQLDTARRGTEGEGTWNESEGKWERPRGSHGPRGGIFLWDGSVGEWVSCTLEERLDWERANYPKRHVRELELKRERDAKPMEARKTRSCKTQE
ncbi:hypothetical protein TeGR_g1390, partial [Tetraparma gracilis]